MSISNQGRNEIRVNNSGAQCLLENWVEERAVSHIDPSESKEGSSGAAQIFKDGHKGILNTDFEASAANTTTVRETYPTPQYPGVAVKGVRTRLMEQAYTQIAADEVKKEQTEKNFRPATEPNEYTTEFQSNFTKEFKTHKPLPTRPHNVNTEQPVTFWTENRERVTGVTGVKTRDTVFRKNAAFSTPISEYWDEAKPYELETVPKM